MNVSSQGTALSTSRSPAASSFTVRARDGFELGATLFGAPKSRLVVVAPAVGVPRSYYRRFSEFLARRGWPTLTFDYRGIGGSRSGSLRGFRASMLDWAEKDLAGALDYATHEARAEKIFVVGHSFGGAALGLAPNGNRASALVGIGSGLGDLSLYPAPDRYAFTAFMRMIPAVSSTMGYLPGKLGGGEDLPRGVAQQWSRWALSRDFFLGGRRASRRSGFESLSMPTRLYSFDDDRYAPRPVVDALAEVYAHANVERRHLAALDHGGVIGHFGFFRPRFEASLWEEVVGFFDGVVRGPGAEPVSEEASLDAFMYDRHHRVLS